MAQKQVVVHSPSSLVSSWEGERPDLMDMGLGVTLRIRGLAMIIDAHIHQTASSLGLRTDDLLLLFALRRGGKPYAMRPTDVYRLLHATSGTATYRVTKLVEQGVAERVKDPMDGRSHLVQLTDKGIEVTNSSIESLSRVSKTALEAFESSEDSQQLEKLLDDLESGWLNITPGEVNPLSRSTLD